MTIVPHRMVALGIVLAIVWAHWVADFIAQSDKMANNKWKSIKWLSIHVAVYTLFLLPFGLAFALINGAAHWCIDYVTARINHWLYYDKKNVHYFFVGVGFDQALHYTVLFITAYALL